MWIFTIHWARGVLLPEQIGLILLQQFYIQPCNLWRHQHEDLTYGGVLRWNSNNVTGQERREYKWGPHHRGVREKEYYRIMKKCFNIKFHLTQWINLVAKWNKCLLNKNLAFSKCPIHCSPFGARPQPFYPFNPFYQVVFIILNCGFCWKKLYLWSYFSTVKNVKK